MTKRKPGGYAYRQEINRAMRANAAARRSLSRLIEEQPGPQMTALLVARAANALGENLAALRELERIVEDIK